MISKVNVAVFVLLCILSNPAYSLDYVATIYPDIGGIQFNETRGISGNSTIGTGQNHALVWNSSTSSYADLHPASGYTYTQGWGVSGETQVGFGGTGFNIEALMWKGTASSVVSLHPAGYLSSRAYGVSGNYQVGSGDGHALMWNGTAASVVDLHSATYSETVAYGISGNKQAGQGYLGGSLRRALLWNGTADSVVDLTPAGFNDAAAWAIDGNYQLGEVNSHAYLWNGTAASGIDLNPANFDSSFGFGISGNFQVGFGDLSVNGGGRHALLWNGTPESALDLHQFLNPLLGLRTSFAMGVNSSGEITGFAYDNSFNFYGVKWTPIPEPSIGYFILIAISVCYLRAKRTYWFARLAN